MELHCRDLGMDCNFVATGDSVAEVKAKAMAHAEEIHADILKTMSSPEQMAEMDKMIERLIQ